MLPHPPLRGPPSPEGEGSFGCTFAIVAEQKARVTYDNLLRLVDDPDVLDPLRFLREREIVHYQRFGDALNMAKDAMDQKNVYAINPAFDKCDQ